MSDKKQSTLADVAEISYLNSTNTVLSKVNGFLSAKITVTKDGVSEAKDYPRIYLHRAFPFDNPGEYISVLDGDSTEIGLIRKLSDFEPEERNMLSEELSRKYYTPKILKIISLKEKYGFSYWTVQTDAGKIDFTLQDTYRSILRVGPTRAFINDISGNRYEIEDTSKLDSQSYKKIELYL